MEVLVGVSTEVFVESAVAVFVVTAAVVEIAVAIAGISSVRDLATRSGLLELHGLQDHREDYGPR